MPWDTSDRRSRLPANWPAIRAAVLRRDSYICHMCHKSGADAVDHIIPGDDHSLTNLAAIHQDVAPFCHRQKSTAEGNAAKERKRRSRYRRTEQHPGMRRPQ